MEGSYMSPLTQTTNMRRRTTLKKLRREDLDQFSFKYIQFEDPLGLQGANSFLFGSRAQRTIQSRRCRFGFLDICVAVEIIRMSKTSGERVWSRTRRSLGIQYSGK